MSSPSRSRKINSPASLPSGPFVRMARGAQIDKASKSLIADIKNVFYYSIEDVVQHAEKLTRGMGKKTVDREAILLALESKMGQKVYVGSQSETGCKVKTPSRDAPQKKSRKPFFEKEQAHYQKELEKGCLFFPKLTFRRIVNLASTKGTKYSKEGLLLLQTAIEGKVILYLSESNLAAGHAKRTVVTWKDLYLVQMIHDPYNVRSELGSAQWSA